MIKTTDSRTWLWGAALAVCVLAVYANSFYGVFHYDDARSIEHNESLRSLASPSRFFFDFENVTRPVVALTFALDYALHGPSPSGFHAINVAAHLSAALLLFGIIRRSLLTEKLREHFEAVASPFAFCAALLWALHPLQTESVTYLVQRSECLMGFFFLLALYALIRGSVSGSPRVWHAVAIGAAALGAGCKQVIVVLPFAALCYDRCFISGTFKSALKRAPLLYAGLCVSWLIVAMLLRLAPSVGSAGFSMDKVKPYNYAWSQSVVIMQYLRLAFWPVGLCLDYAWKIERDPLRIIPCVVFILGLLGVTLWQLRKNTAIGFCGAWFFLTLAPTSSILPIADLAVEHRMYLTLAAIAVLVTAALYWSVSRAVARQTVSASRTVALFVGLGIVSGASLGVGTMLRNRTYFDQRGMLLDVISKSPDNPRAYSALAMNALRAGDTNEALAMINSAVALRSNLSEVHHMKGVILLAGRSVPEAIAEFKAALAINPRNAYAWIGLSDAWIARDPSNTGIRGIASALKRNTANPAIHLDLGSALAGAQRFDDALFEFNAALALQPDNESAIVNKGKVYELTGREAEALQTYQSAVASYPNQAMSATSLAWIKATSADTAVRNGVEAVALAERACARTQDKNALMLDTLAAAYAEANQFDKAIASAEKALEREAPNSVLHKEIEAHLVDFKQGKPIRTKK